MPAVLPGSWLLLVSLGVVIGLIYQGALLPHVQVASGRVFPISLLAVAAALVGAKTWYVALNLRSSLADHRQHCLVPLLSHAQFLHGRDCDESAESSETDQPKVWDASAECLSGRINRTRTQDLAGERGFEPLIG